MSSVTDEIKARIDLVDLVGRAVPLKRSGTSFKGLCPFHQEKTPSFHVFPDSHTWVCFGCGKKGTAFDWLMEHEHLDFGEALRTLAGMAGVQLPERRSPRQEEEHARLFDLLARAQVYYHGALQGAVGAVARRYLAERGVAEESLDGFGLGYAAPGNGLLQHLAAGGFTEDEMVAAGVVSVADDGRHYDFFRERVLFPIRDTRGRTIAFGGRALGDGTPKYLNSRDTLLFHKQETLFAIDLARKPIAQERRAVVVEGYMDALTAHQHGYRNVVATLGTAVTDRHLTLLKHLADEIVLALDSDAAGQAAAWRALQVAENSLVSGMTPIAGPNRRTRQYAPARAAQLKVLTIPGAKDPDDLIRSDPAAWAQLVQTARPVVEFALEQLPRRHDLTNARGKATAADEIAELLATVANPVEQAHYVQRTAAILGVDEPSVRRIVRGKQAAWSPPRGEHTAPHRRGDENEPPLAEPPDALDDYALALLLRLRPPGQGVPPHLLDGLDFALAESRALGRALGQGPRLELPAELRPRLDHALRELTRVQALSEDDAVTELRTVGLEMQERALTARQAHLHRLVAAASEDEETAQLRQELVAVARRLGGIEEALRERGARPLLAEAPA